MKWLALFFVGSVVLSGSVAAAAGATDTVTQPAIGPVMTQPDATLLDEPFVQSLPKTWRAAKGEWKIVDGALRGTEIPSDQHQAVIRRPLAFTNVVIAFSFRLDHARQISLSVNDAKEHVCRLIVNARGFVVQKDDHDHAGPDKPVVFARVPMSLDTATWHTVVVEIDRAQMVAQIDDSKHVGFGAHELIDRPKANFGFTVAGGPAEFRDVRLAAATSRPDWPAVKARLVEQGAKAR
jgi:hypothetical protein